MEVNPEKQNIHTLFSKDMGVRPTQLTDMGGTGVSP